MKNRTTRCTYLAGALLFALSSTYRDIKNWTTRCMYLTNSLLFALTLISTKQKTTIHLSYVCLHV